MKRLINIMQIVLSLECGGLEKVAISLAERLGNSKFNTLVCCFDNLGELVREAEDRGIKVIMVKRKRGRDFSLPLRLASVLRKEKIDLVHTHNLGPLFYGTLAAKIARIPIVINTRHGREKKISNRFIWNLNDEIIAISEDARRELLKCNHINPAKVKVIYNGISANLYAKQINVEDKKNILNLDSSILILGTVARLYPEKDHFTLLSAFSKVVQRITKAKLIIVGDGILRGELENHCRKLGIEDKVLFLGFLQDISEILGIFDVFVLSSITEGISLTLLEAMAAGKPIVATNVGGNPEVVVDEETGLLVPPKNPERMSDAITTLFKNKELAKKMGEAGRKRVEKEFSLDRMIKKYENVYDYWLQKKRVV